jgi:hypothetical protein
MVHELCVCGLAFWARGKPWLGWGTRLENKHITIRVLWRQGRTCICILLGARYVRFNLYGVGASGF